MAGDVPKKILWIFIFLILAAIAILGVLFIRGYQSGRHIATVESSPTPEPSATAETKETLDLTLENPTTDIATSSARIAVTGKTIGEGVVSITGGSEDALTQAQKDGSFSIPVALTEGLNRLRVTAFNDDGDEKSIMRYVLYTKGAL